MNTNTDQNGTGTDGGALWELLAELQATRRHVRDLAARIGRHLDGDAGQRAQLTEATEYATAAMRGLERITRRRAAHDTAKAAAVLDALDRNGAELTDAQRRVVLDSLAVA